MKAEQMNGATPEIDSEIPENAVRLYGQSDAMDDFPVLKAFQQYIDSEQAKARKRMLSLGIFFGILMSIVIAVFVGLLLNFSSRNQALNDRIIEFVMKDRDRVNSPVVVQPPVQQDNSAILALTSKLEEMQKKLNESQVKEAEAKRQAEIEAAKPKGPTPEELEIKRLNALLAAEKEQRAAEKARQDAEKARQDAEKERQRQLELEEYRRKHYPELYEKKKEDSKPKDRAKSDSAAHAELLQEIDQILGDEEAVTYYDEDEDENKEVSKPKAKARREPQQKKDAPAPQKEYSIPVDVRGSSGRWSVPNE